MYINKIDDLMYYTNGSIDLKRYIKYIMDTNPNIINPMTTDFTRVNIPPPIYSDLNATPAKIAETIELAKKTRININPPENKIEYQLYNPVNIC